MKQLIFSTGNRLKFTLGADTCRSFDIELMQKELDIDEIQAEDPEKIVRDKAQKAYALLKQPVIVSDDSWFFLGLNGFPGPYMKSMNQWLQIKDFSNLTKDLSDRRVQFVAYLAYADGTQVHVFHNQKDGILLTEPKGTTGSPSERIISMLEDNGLSISEVFEKKMRHADRTMGDHWRDFAHWFVAQP